MFKEFLFSSSALWWMYFPLLVIALLTALLAAYWKRYLRDGPSPPQAAAINPAPVNPIPVPVSGRVVEYKLETLRAPINGGLTAAGIVIPLVAGLIAYLASQSIPVKEMTPLGVSLVFLVLSVVIGLGNLFSMTSSSDDKITITKDKHWLNIPIIELQFLLAIAALLVLMIYFVTSFGLPKAAATSSTPVPGTNVLVARPFVRTGMATQDIVSAWGGACRHKQYGCQNNLDVRGCNKPFSACGRNWSGSKCN